MPPTLRGVSDLKEYAPFDLNIQRIYHYRLIHLNQLLIKHDIGQQLNYRDIKKMLYLVILFSDLMRRELVNDSDVLPVLQALDLYRWNKEAFVQNVYHDIVVFWARNGKFVKAEIYPDIKAYEAKKKERHTEGLKEMKVEPLPKLDHIVFLARKIVEIGARLGILELVVERRPRFVVDRKVLEELVGGEE